MFVDEDVVATSLASTFAVVNHLVLSQMSEGVGNLLDPRRAAVKVLEGLGAAEVDARSPIAMPQKKAVHRMGGRSELAPPEVLIQAEEYRNEWRHLKLRNFIVVYHGLLLLSAAVNPLKAGDVPHQIF
jgi:hypothetical protein